MLLSDFTPEERAMFEKKGIDREFAGGDYIIKEGEKGTSLFIVQSGAVEIRKSLGETNYKCLKELGEGEFFGEMGFLGAHERTASAIALELCRVREITPDEFGSLTSDNPSIGVKVYRNLARDLVSRLRKNTDELKKALAWVIEEMEI